jgi:hypothetical protein
VVRFKIDFISDSSAETASGDLGWCRHAFEMWAWLGMLIDTGGNMEIFGFIYAMRGADKQTTPS